MKGPGRPLWQSMARVQAQGGTGRRCGHSGLRSGLSDHQPTASLACAGRSPVSPTEVLAATLQGPSCALSVSRAATLLSDGNRVSGPNTPSVMCRDALTEGATSWCRWTRALLVTNATARARLPGGIAGVLGGWTGSPLQGCPLTDSDDHRVRGRGLPSSCAPGPMLGFTTLSQFGGGQGPGLWVGRPRVDF